MSYPKEDKIQPIPAEFEQANARIEASRRGCGINVEALDQLREAIETFGISYGQLLRRKRP